MTDSPDEEKQKGRGPGKANARVKHNLIQTFDRIGGIDKLAQWAEQNQTEFYRLWAKLLPVQMRHSGKLDHDHSHVVKPVSETAAWIERVAGAGAEGPPKESLPH